jgi:hypothetical protein
MTNREIADENFVELAVQERDGLDALGWPPLGDPLTPKLVLVAAGPRVAPELGQNIAPCVGGALVRR